jgi:hypothetical protein
MILQIICSSGKYRQLSLINIEVIGLLMVAKVRLTFLCPFVQIQLFEVKMSMLL